MAIEKFDGGTVITGPDIEMFRVLQVVHGLALEINNPGMRLSNKGSVMKVAKSWCGSTKNTKVRVLADFVIWLRSHRPDYTPSERVAKALGTMNERQLTGKMRASLGL